MSVYAASTPTANTPISPANNTTVATASTTTTTPSTTTTIAAEITSTTAAVAATATTTTTAATAPITTTATTSTATAPSPEAATGWIEFCERHARASASDFAKAFCAYVSLNLPESARANLSHRDFLRKFVESFCEHFESEYLRQSVRYAIARFFYAAVALSESLTFHMLESKHWNNYLNGKHTHWWKT